MADSVHRRVPRWAVVVVLGLAFLLGGWLHQSFDGSLSPSGLREWVRSWGNLGPVLFVLVLTFRQFLFLPSLLLVSVGGLCFGVFWGTLLGGLGLFLSGVITFSLGRGLGGDRVRRWVQAKFPDFDERLESVGPWLVFGVMVYPGGPMTGVFWASGLSAIPFAPFALAVALGGLVRAFTYSFFGASLSDGLTPEFYVAVAVMAAIFILPLCFPSVRRMFSGWRG